MTKRAAIVGATGYTGSELARFLHSHPDVTLGDLVGHSRAGEPVGMVLPNLQGVIEQNITAFDPDTLASNHDLAFCALPHGASAQTVSALRARGLIVFDLSADFRLRDRDAYAQWYGNHGAPELFGTATYGLVEVYEAAIAESDLIAVPGCYPTSALLGLIPLLQADLIEHTGIIVDAKSGVSGAGRKPGLHAHYSEIAEGFRAYKSAGQHRHIAEIEQELSAAAGATITISFTPHLVPMTRGILATSYASAKPNVDAHAATRAAREMYEGSESVTVLEAGSHPDTAWVRGANRAMISYGHDTRTGRIIIQCAIDNLVKGASGQAVQCMNVRLGLAPATGLPTIGLWP